MIYAKKNLSVTELDLDVLNDFNQCSAVNVKLNNDNLNICLVYRPHNTYDETDVALNNSKLCDVLAQLPKPYFICGDFNYSCINWNTGKSTAKSSEFYKATFDNFLTQHVDFPTHRSGTTPDLVLSSNSNYVTSVDSIGPLGASDHVMILTDLDVKPEKKNTKKNVKDWKNADFDVIKESLHGVNWDDMLNGQDPEAAWCTFTQVVGDTLDEHVPLRTVRSSKRAP